MLVSQDLILYRCSCSNCKGIVLQTYRTCKNHMAKHPPANIANANFDDVGRHESDICVNIIDTSFSNNAQSQFVTETCDLVETFADIDDHGLLQSQHFTAGGPPGVLSIFDSAVSVLSQHMSNELQKNKKQKLF